MRRNTVIEYVNLHIKKTFLNSSNLILKLEYRQVEVKFISRKVKRLKLEDTLLVFLYLESGNDQ